MFFLPNPLKFYRIASILKLKIWRLFNIPVLTVNPTNINPKPQTAMAVAGNSRGVSFPGYSIPTLASKLILMTYIPLLKVSC